MLFSSNMQFSYIANQVPWFNSIISVYVLAWLYMLKARITISGSAQPLTYTYIYHPW